MKSKAPPTTPTPAGATPAPVEDRKARILVVDDEDQVVQIFRDLLTQQGYEVVSSDNGDDAITKVTTGRFDLVLTDINLPGVDGLEVVRAAKAADKDTVVILITGYASTNTAIDALRQGAYDYITKPFDLWETAKAIERGLESRQLTIENRRLIEQLEGANRELQQHEESLRRKVERATHRLASLYEAGKAMSSSLSLQATCDVVVAQAARLTSARACLLFLHDADSDDYAAEAGFGIPEDRFQKLRFSMGLGYHGHVVQNARPTSVTDLQQAVGIEEVFSALRAENALIVPLVSNESVIGTITALDHDGAPEFTTEDSDVLMMLASQATIAITNAILYERTKELDRLKSDFVAVVSHEVRTPLTSIKGSLELLGDDRFHKLPPPQKELLGICQANTERLISLINDILDFSKLESSRLSLNFEQMDVGRVLSEVVENIRNLAAIKGVELDVRIDSATGSVEADPMRIGQVATNLIGNAIKFSPERGKIEIFASGDSSNVTISVKDYGKGIAQRDLSRLFQRFAQLDSSTTRKAGGTGLGLVISKGIVEQHGGKIWVESSLGRGSTFSFSLPRKHVDPAA
ncbi:MAG TPA: ATP-binding protein [Candidatus Eisenbacteria bacterium]|nr:ATP-binding protein [Candidatus Eisenbacteria bacterium]